MTVPSPMRVELIARTHTEQRVLSAYMDPDTRATFAETLVEFAGRTCYQSFHKPNPKTAANEDYLANIIKQGHESVLEHASASFAVSGVTRNMLLELERHRHLSFSVVSTRYVDQSYSRVLISPALREAYKQYWRPLTDEEFNRYRETVDGLQALGLNRKQAREAAMGELPGNLETKFVVTGNHRAWRDMLKKRWNEHANLEIRQWAGEVLRLLRGFAPSIYADIPKEPYP
jgi:thymidylate synthase (FAD)